MSKGGDEIQLKDALKAMLDHYRLKGKYQQSRLRSLWPKLMGPSIDLYTTEVKVYRKTLYVRISSAALRQELSMGTEKIKKMMNEELGENYIENVVIR